MTAPDGFPFEIDFLGDLGQAFVGNKIDTLVLNEVRRAIEARALTPENVRRESALYVPTPSHHDALAALQRHGVVALFGQRGDGRRITSVRVAADLRLPPHDLLLDPEEPNRAFRMRPGEAYLLDLDGLPDQPDPGTRDAMLGHLAALPEGSVLIMRATEGVWRGLGLDERVPAVRVRPPSDPVTVFAAHLTAQAAEADSWSAEPAIRAELADARPSDAVRLAKIVDEVLAVGPRDRATQLAEAIAAYRKWTDHLTRWFDETAEPSQGHLRALKLAAAALEGAPVATVFAAADQLATLVDLPRAPGQGLAGPGVDALIAAIDARRKGDRIRFPRPEYADSVLAHVWRDRPHLHDALHRWLANVPTGDPETQRAGHTLARLALRQGDPRLLTWAAGGWARRPELRPLAVQVLTAAGVSPELGRPVRRRLYHWATHALPQDIHLLVAEVCGGELAEAFPQIALTRLRHLADRDGAEVRAAVLTALTRLASGHLLPAVLREVVDWITLGEGRGRQDTGRAAFLSLAALRSSDRVAILPATPDPETDRLLTEAWRGTFRHQPTRDDAVKTAIGWLESAAQAHADPSRVTRILAATCRSSRDRGVLHAISRRWDRSDESPAVFSRREISDRFMSLVADRDPLTAPREHSYAR